MQIAGQTLDLFDDFGVNLGRVAARLQQGEDQRREFVSHRQAGEADARCFTRTADGERWAQLGITVLAQADLGGLFGNILEQAEHLLRGRPVIERGDDFDRLLQLFKVGLELGFDVCVEHAVLPLLRISLKRGSQAPLR